MGSLQNKVAIITGASSGIGKASAHLFASEGAAIIVAARRQDELQQVTNSITANGRLALTVAGDVREESFAKQLGDTATHHFAEVDIAFNNAGVLRNINPITNIELEHWNQILTSNFTSAFLGVKHQIPAMLKPGGVSITLTSTFVGYNAGISAFAAYAASKSALIGLTWVLASDYKSRNIHINALLPGGTDTPMGRQFSNTPEAESLVNSLHTLKRMANPEEITQSACYLASDLRPASSPTQPYWLMTGPLFTESKR